MSTANPFASARTSTPPASSPAEATAPAAGNETPKFQAAQPSDAHPATFDSAPSTKPEKKAAGGGDPFGDPAGPGSGERIADMVGSLLLVKPTEYIAEMTTRSGTTDAVRADIAVLDETDDAGRIADGVLVFQMALKRDLEKIMDGPSTYLLGRLVMGEAKQGKNAPYIFEMATDADKALARQFLAVQKL